MTTARLDIPAKLVPVFSGKADIRGAKGGRGSAKTRTFAKMTAVRAHMWAQAGEEGLILCGRQYMNSLEDSSLEEIKAAIRETPWLLPHFDIGEKYIRTACRRISYTFAGLDRNISSIKSKARLRLCWVDEAEAVTDAAWQVLIPTLREEDSELWLTWNPERKTSATNKRFGGPQDDPLVKIVEMNWRDNPWFPAILERKRLKDEAERPEDYAHIWEGAYKAVTKGAYYASQVMLMKAEKRLGRVAADPLLTIRLFMDIGGTGAKADNFVIWAVQFVGKEIRVLNHYEKQGQPIAAHLKWMREQGYDPGTAQVWLPHDGDNNDKVYDVSYRSAFEDAGYVVTVVPNQGTGAAMFRVEALRRVFPSIWMNQATTEAGLEAISAYKAKLDEKRETDLGPDHDWASHSADALGMVAIVYEEPTIQKKKREPHSVSWMG
jgi:phage terminase large subunit